MALGFSGLLLAIAGCAATPASNPAPVASCRAMNCFRERDIRDVQLLNSDTLLVFIGPQRCAFRMELDGPYCGAAGFTIDFDLDRRGHLLGGQQPLICVHDQPYIRDAFGRSTEGVLPGGRGSRPSPAETFNRCRVVDIIPLTDDELIETYVEAGAPPLPPVGSGEISVGDEEAGAETPGDGAADRGSSGPESTGRAETPMTSP